MTARRRRRKRPVIIVRLAKIFRTLVREAKTLVFVPVLVIVLLAAAYWGWQAARAYGLGSTEYRLEPWDIAVNSPPGWITEEDLKAAVIRDASLDQPLSILDDRLNERIALAFAAHPWVEKVARVEKFHPARVQVRLAYRTPVAVVIAQQNLAPVDKFGVRLPEKDFSQTELEKFPRIFGISFRHRAAAGIPWGDPRVEGAARIADAVGSSWAELGLAGILPFEQPVQGQNVYRYQLITQNGTRINWGRQFLQPDANEPTAEEKFERLKRHAKLHGTLDGLSLQRPPTGVGDRLTARSEAAEVMR